MIIMSGPSRGVAAGAVASGGSGGESKLLSLNPANSGNPDYVYWDLVGSLVGCYKLPEGLAGPGPEVANTTRYHYAYGRLGRGSTSSKLYVASAHTGSTFAEINIPALVNNTSNPNALNRATFAVSAFSAMQQSVPVNAPTGGTGWGEGGAHATGWWRDPETNRLIVNCTAYYGGGEQWNSVVYDDASDISDHSGKRGFFQVRYDPSGENMQGGRVCSGWLSDIPVEFQGPDKLNGLIISGNSDGYSTRFYNASIGPSAWILNPHEITRTSPITNGGVWEGIPALSYPHISDGSTCLVSDAEADSGNPLWTIMSFCVFAFIVPGTRTYLCVGGTGGNVSGIDYGVPPYGGTSGYYTIDPEDVGSFYWLISVDDMIASVQGLRDPWDTVPYEFGYLELPWQGEKTAVDGAWNYPTGAVYVPETEQLHIATLAADEEGLDVISVFQKPSWG